MAAQTLLQYLQTAHFRNPPCLFSPDPNTPSDASFVDIGKVETEWKARRAIKDPGLWQNLCSTLHQILEPHRAPLRSEDISRLSCFFLPDCPMEPWDQVNNSKAYSAVLVLFIMLASKACLRAYNAELKIVNEPKHFFAASSSRVDYATLLNGEERVLVKVKSPAFMRELETSLPPVGQSIVWKVGQHFTDRMFLKAALYLGLCKKEWLFMTCHNSWVVFRLQKVNKERVLFYSPVAHNEGSSVPFRSFFCTILSAVENVPVPPSILPKDIILPVPKEDPNQDNDFEIRSNDSDSDHGLSIDHESSGDDAKPRRISNDNELMLTSSSIESPTSYWAYLKGTAHSSYFSFPVFSGKADSRMRITRFLGMGSTGSVYAAQLGDKSFAVKVVQIFSPDDVAKREQLQSEYRIYAYLERAYDKGKLVEGVSPRCYGLFSNRLMDVLVMELHGENLTTWDELLVSERWEIFKLAMQLHYVGVRHGDLETRNIVRTDNGGFVLVDFTSSAVHKCPDRRRLSLHQPPPVEELRCSELRDLRQELEVEVENDPGNP